MAHIDSVSKMRDSMPHGDDLQSTHGWEIPTVAKFVSVSQLLYIRVFELF
jgi:hypothetical protein